MKSINLLSWIGFIAGIILMILGFIDFLYGGGVFGFKHSSTFFTVANSSILLGLFLKIFLGTPLKKAE